MALETMDLHEVRSAMEGILFAAGEPVNIDRICLALELDKPTAEIFARTLLWRLMRCALGSGLLIISAHLLTSWRRSYRPCGE